MSHRYNEFLRREDQRRFQSTGQKLQTASYLEDYKVPREVTNIDGEQRDLFSDALQCLAVCLAVARTLFLLSYLCPGMTFLLIKRNCFYNTLTEI